MLIGRPILSGRHLLNLDSPFANNGIRGEARHFGNPVAVQQQRMSGVDLGSAWSSQS